MVIVSHKAVYFKAFCKSLYNWLHFLEMYTKIQACFWQFWRWILQKKSNKTHIVARYFLPILNTVVVCVAIETGGPPSLTKKEKKHSQVRVLLDIRNLPSDIPAFVHYTMNTSDKQHLVKFGLCPSEAAELPQWSFVLRTKWSAVCHSRPQALHDA